MMLNWFRADFQFLIGIVQRFAVFVKARSSSLNIASSFGKGPVLGHLTQRGHSHLAHFYHAKQTTLKKLDIN